MRFLFGLIIGATLMYLFDPRQGQDRRELWGERLRKGRHQAEHAVETGKHAVETGKHTFDEAKAKAQETADAARSRMDAFRGEQDEEHLPSEADPIMDEARESVSTAVNGDDYHDES